MIQHRASVLAGWLFLCLILATLDTIAFANNYDPHVYPKKGPFFEGWYARITDGEQSRSLGVLFGRVLPSANSLETDLSSTYLSFLRSKGGNESMEV